MERNISCDQLSTVEGRRFLAVPVRNKNEWRKRWRYGFLSFLLFSFCSLVWIPVLRGCSGPCASICGNFFIVQVITMKMAAAQRTHENGSQVASFEVKHTGTIVYIIMNNHTCVYICIICIYIYNAHFVPSSRINCGSGRSSFSIGCLGIFWIPCGQSRERICS